VIINALREVKVLTWIHGIPRPLTHTYTAPPEEVAGAAIARGDAVALGQGDYVTAECEGWGEWDIPYGGGGELVWRCRRAQQQAWDAWRDAASAAAREIADTLADDWSLSIAALAETAELLAELNGGTAA
jgi:hypothetical protein